MIPYTLSHTNSDISQLWFLLYVFKPILTKQLLHLINTRNTKLDMPKHCKGTTTLTGQHLNCLYSTASPFFLDKDAAFWADRIHLSMHKPLPPFSCKASPWEQRNNLLPLHHPRLYPQILQSLLFPR